MNKFSKFRLGDLFEFEAIKQAKSQREIPTDDSGNGIPYVVQSMFNNMFSRNVNKQWLIDHNEPPISGNRIVLGVTLPAVSYQPQEFGASQVITARADWLNRKTGIYLVTVISKMMYQFSYSKKPGLQIYKDMEIELPVTDDGKIDFPYMENRIRELEADRIRELEAYLKVTGLSDYTLTAAEQAVLAEFRERERERERESKRFAQFRIIDLFTVKNTRNILSRDITDKNGAAPYLTASQADNAVGAYINHDNTLLDKGNCIFIGGKTFVVTYQEADFFSNDSHNLALYLKDEAKKTKETQLFMVAAINRSLSHLYSWGDSISSKKIQKDTVELPVDTRGDIDYDFMTLFIKAQQKLAIKDVVEWRETYISATRQLVAA